MQKLRLLVQEHSSNRLIFLVLLLQVLVLRLGLFRLEGTS